MKFITKFRIVCYGIFICLSVLTVLIVSCDQKKPTNEDRAPLENEILIHDPVATYDYGSPDQFALVKGEEYHLSYSFDKYFDYQMDKMRMEISLPNNVYLVDGQTSWNGMDKHITIDIVIKPLSVGEFEIIGKVFRADNYEDGIQHTLIICVGETASEAKNMLRKPKYPQEIE